MLLCLCPQLEAQNIDSLLRELPKQKEDTNKVNLLFKLVRAYTFKDPEQRQVHIRSMISLSRKLNYAKGEAKGYSAYADYYMRINETDSAAACINMASGLFRKANDKWGLATVAALQGQLNTDLHQYDKALTNYQEALTYAENADNKVQQAIILGSISRLFFVMKRYEEAERYYLRSLDLYQQTGNKRGISLCLLNLSTIRFLMEDYPKSEYYTDACLETQKELQDVAILAKCHLNKGFFYSERKDHDRSLAILDMSYNEFAQVYDTINMTYALMYQAHTYSVQHEHDDALRKMSDAMTLARQIDADSLTIGSLYQEYYAIYKEMGDYEQALNYYEMSVRNNSELFSTETADKISELQEKYETEKKERENTALKDRQEIQQLKLQRQSYLIYGMMGILLLSVLVFVLLLRTGKAMAEQKNMRLKQKLLRSQMNPHFIFNALIAIQGYIYKNDPKAAGKFLASFAKLMRGILENSREEYISLTKEIGWTEHYIGLQKLRFDGNFTYTIEADESLDRDNILIPPMLTQPFIENALEHGLMESGGRLQIVFSRSDAYLKVSIADNGAGFDTSQPQLPGSRHASLAIKITEERLRLLNRRKSKKIRFSIHSEPGKGTTVELLIPVRTKR